nr:PTS glucose transporter subunit IIA [uncultured Mediterraneibacter sp.]
MFEFLKKKKEKQAMDNAGEEIVAVMNGTIFPLEEVSDPAFAGKILGDGIAFTPTEKQSTIVSPVDGEITCLFPTGHAFGVTMENGVEILVHIGIDTVEAEGRGFEILGKAEQKVKAGDPVVKVDFEKLQREYDMSVMLIVTNENQKDIRFFKDGSVVCGEVIGRM